MKLDRNINKDGRGKYALIQMRKASADEAHQIRDFAGTSNTVVLSGHCIHPIATPCDQFFVLKYKDRFAQEGMRAYAEAVRSYALHNSSSPQERESLLEYYQELQGEIRKMQDIATKTPS